MVMSNEEWLVFALHWKLSAFGQCDFEVVSMGDLVDVYYRDGCSNLQFAQYPDEDFEEVISDALTLVARYYNGDIDVVQHRTRHRKKLEYIFRDYDSGDFYHFTED